MARMSRSVNRGRMSASKLVSFVIAYHFLLSHCRLTSPLRSIRKYGQYHRPIAQAILFGLNGDSSNTEENPMATLKAPAKLTQMNTPTKPAQIRLARRSPAYWRVTIDNPPINVMGPEMVKQFREVINALEADEQV